MPMIDVDSSNAKPMGEFGTLPEGEYVAYIESSDKKQSNSGNFYLETVWIVREGQFEGRKFWVNYNLWNENPSAVDIALSAWRSTCEATIGVPAVDMSEKLHNRPCIVKLGIGHNPKSNKPTNEAKAFRSLASGQLPAPPASNPAVSTTGAATNAPAPAPVHTAPQASVAPAPAANPGQRPAPWAR